MFSLPYLYPGVLEPDVFENQKASAFIKDIRGVRATGNRALPALVQFREFVVLKVSFNLSLNLSRGGPTMKQSLHITC